MFKVNSKDTATTSGQTHLKNLAAFDAKFVR